MRYENPALRESQHRCMVASMDLLLAELERERMATLLDDCKARQAAFEASQLRRSR